jgi:hypothetical protein
MADLTREQSEALDVARALVVAGVPVFRARPALNRGVWLPDGGSGGCGYWIPTGWERKKPDPDVIDKWRPGEALCALMGHVLDLVDLDPRNGGDPAALNGAMPRTYAVAVTPSEGWHGFVRTLGVRSRDKVLPGIDVKAGDPDGKGRGFAFIAPTVRKSKTTGEPVAYRWVRPPDLDALAAADDHTGERLAALVRAAHGSTSVSRSEEDVVGPDLKPSPWDDLAATIAANSRHDAVHKLASALKGQGGWRVESALAYLRAVVFPLLDQTAGKDPHPYTLAELEADVRDVFTRYPDGHGAVTREVDPAGATWARVDLGPYVRGEHVRPEPTVGIARVDGLRLLYPGKEHAVIGEMESGKSWLAVACVAAELTLGWPVVYIHFEEADPTDTVQRLQALGVPDDTILTGLVFVGPNEPVDPFALAVLLDPAPSLVVLGGVNEAMSLHRLNPREEDAVAVFRHRLVKPCTAAGAAVLACDHVVKDRDRRGRDAMGSVHKGNGLTGSLILLENVAPYGRGERGCSHVYVTKDRPGHLRRHGRPSKMPGKTYIGSLIVDDTRTTVDRLDLVLVEPPEQTAPDEAAGTRDQSDDDKVLSVVAEVTALGAEPSQRAVEAKTSGMSNDRIRNALTRLVLDKRLTEREGPRKARLFTLPTAPEADYAR